MRRVRGGMVWGAAAGFLPWPCAVLSPKELEKFLGFLRLAL